MYTTLCGNAEKLWLQLPASWNDIKKLQKILDYVIWCSLHGVLSDRVEIRTLFVIFCFLLPTGLTRAGDSIGGHAMLCKLQEETVHINSPTFQGSQVSEKTFLSVRRLGHLYVCLTTNVFCLSEKEKLNFLDRCRSAWEFPDIFLRFPDSLNCMTIPSFPGW